jgi:hypothetical protein
METHDYVVYFYGKLKPYNTKLVLSLNRLESLITFIEAEVLSGMVGTRTDDRVIVYLNLDYKKQDIQKEIFFSNCESELVQPINYRVI